ncbi:MAG: hypothetical protein ACRD3Q_15690, partial [Terriglobales bacterium]
MIGGAARIVGRNAASAAELDPAHRRDGVALLLLGFGIVSAIAVWFGRAGAFGEALTMGLRFLVGSGAMVIPLVALVGAVHLMRQAPDESQRGRIMVGAVTLSAGALGLLHLARSSPDTPTAWSRAAGAIGLYVATPLTNATSIWVSSPLLVLLTIFGLLVITATPINSIPGLVRRTLDFVFGAPQLKEDSPDAPLDESGAGRRRR